MNIFEGLFHLLILNFEEFVTIFNNIPVEITWILFLFFCFTSILIFLKIFGEVGLYVYTVIAVIAANIQVLKIVEFPFFKDPVALGTILFCSTYLCTDILAEYYGTKSARKNIFLGFSGFLLITLIMLFTLGFKPIEEMSISSEYAWATSIQDNMLSIFMPFPILFGASMVAYLFSQFFDVWFFEKISFLTKGKFLWLRNNFSTMISSLLDNIIFSLFAWIIFNPNPLDFSTVFFTYILGTYFLRILVAIFDTPFVYLAKKFVS